jgi:plasmid maintenance system antidote protein VapI
MVLMEIQVLLMVVEILVAVRVVLVMLQVKTITVVMVVRVSLLFHGNMNIWPNLKHESSLKNTA